LRRNKRAADVVAFTVTDKDETLSAGAPNDARGKMAGLGEAQLMAMG
jgi:hypothetical protein